MSSRTFLESVEEGFVFRVSRGFFLVLIVLMMLTVLGGAGFFMWGLLPASPPGPAKAITITAKDVQQYLASNPVEAPSAETPPAATTGSSEVADQAAFEAQMDSLRQLLPAPTYSWDEVYSTVGEGVDQHVAVTEKGINNYLKELFEPYTTAGEILPVIRSLVAVVHETDAKDRLKTVQAFVRLHKQRYTAAKEKDQTAQAEYENRQTEKMLASSSGGIVVLSAIMGMAFTAMFLVLLSVQRNIRKLVEKQ